MDEKIDGLGGMWVEQKTQMVQWKKRSKENEREWFEDGKRGAKKMKEEKKAAHWKVPLFKSVKHLIFSLEICISPSMFSIRI